MFIKNGEFYNSDETFLISHKKVTGFFSMNNNHFHDYYEIYYLISGERSYFVKDRVFHLKKGCLLFTNINELHRTTDAVGPNHERLLIKFHKRFIMTLNGSIQKIIDSIVQNEYLVLNLPLKEQQYVEGLLSGMTDEANNRLRGFEVNIQAILMQLLVYISRFVEKEYILTNTHPSDKHEKVSEIVKYINTHYMEKLDVKGVAKHFYISPFYLSRIFKETTGFTFVEYINSIRVKEAQRLLASTRYKAIQISEKVGFGSITSFNRVFKEVSGYSPLNFRKRLLQSTKISN